MSSNRKEQVGIVISAKTPKTLVVRVERRAPEPKFGKLMKSTKKYHVHDEQGAAREGDMVKIIESRPLSKTKRWRLAAVVAHATMLAVPAEQVGA
jgi:small subunit ribosomal protein S17